MGIVNTWSNKPAFVTLLAAMALTGCIQSIPKCSDESTLKMAKELFAKQLAEFSTSLGTKLDAKQLESRIKFDFISASKFEENIKKYTCDAILIDETDGKKMPVSYTSQINDIGEHIVSIGGLSETIASALMQSIASTEMARDTTLATKSDTRTTSPEPAQLQSSSEYKEAYACAIESYKDGYQYGPNAFLSWKLQRCK